MNTSRLQQLFAHYIDKFEYINNPELNENYKWEIVKQYQDIFNLDAPDLAGMLTEAWRITSNLIDSQFQQPILCSYRLCPRGTGDRPHNVP